MKAFEIQNNNNPEVHRWSGLLSEKNICIAAAASTCD